MVVICAGCLSDLFGCCGYFLRVLLVGDCLYNWGGGGRWLYCCFVFVVFVGYLVCLRFWLGCGVSLCSLQVLRF